MQCSVSTESFYDRVYNNSLSNYLAVISHRGGKRICQWGGTPRSAEHELLMEVWGPRSRCPGAGQRAKIHWSWKPSMSMFIQKRGQSYGFK